MHSHIWRLLRHIGKPLIVLVTVAATATSAFALTVAPPTISILAVDPVQAPLVVVPVFTWRTDGRALEFGASVTRFESRPVDVYFGAIIPGGRTFSWISGPSNTPVPMEGLVPLARGITATTFHTIELLEGRSPQQAFTPDHPVGLYSVFVLLVLAGADPADPHQWVGVTMSPLMISN